MIGREELVDGELDMAEDLAGIILAAAAVAGALLFRHTIVVDRNEKLGIALQADEGELAKGDIEPLALAAEAQLAAEAGADAGRHVGELAVAGTALAGIYQLQAKDQGINGLHD